MKLNIHTIVQLSQVVMANMKTVNFNFFYQGFHKFENFLDFLGHEDFANVCPSHGFKCGRAAVLLYELSNLLIIEST